MSAHQSDHPFRDIPGGRPLSAREHDILRRLVASANGAEQDALLCQVESGKVIRECVVACGTVVLDSDRQHCRAHHYDNIVYSAQTRALVGPPLAVTLFVTDGFIRLLECYREDGFATNGLPQPDDLEYLGG